MALRYVWTHFAVCAVQEAAAIKAQGKDEAHGSAPGPNAQKALNFREIDYAHSLLANSRQAP